MLTTPVVAGCLMLCTFERFLELRKALMNRQFPISMKMNGKTERNTAPTISRNNNSPLLVLVQTLFTVVRVETLISVVLPEITDVEMF